MKRKMSVAQDNPLTLLVFPFYSFLKIEFYLESDTTPGSSRIIIVTLNGQRHAYFNKSFIKQTRSQFRSSCGKYLAIFSPLCTIPVFLGA